MPGLGNQEEKERSEMKKLLEFETFRKIGFYEQGNLTFEKPSSVNGDLRVIKYKITVEEIEEPKEVINQRIQKLWEECKNWHEHSCIKEAAKKCGYELKGSFGEKRKR